MCKQREDIWRQRSGNAQTMEKKEAVIINCSEMRTEGTSRSSAEMSLTCHLSLAHVDDGEQEKSTPCNLVPALEFSLKTYLLCL